MIKTCIKITDLLKITCVLFSIVFITSCGGEKKDYVESTVEDPTQGILAEIEEVEENRFKINNEEIIAKREDSRIIAKFLNGTIDTFTLDEITLVEANNPNRSMMRSVLMGGMIGYMMGRPMSTPINRQSYASDNAYNKSNSGTNQLRSTATRRTVRTPKANSSSGYGSRKSSRSYGG
jgi:hypothetical protein